MVVKLEQKKFLSTAIRSMKRYTNFVKGKDTLAPSNFISIPYRNSYYEHKEHKEKYTKTSTATLIQIVNFFLIKKRRNNLNFHHQDNQF